MAQESEEADRKEGDEKKGEEEDGGAEQEDPRGGQRGRER